MPTNPITAPRAAEVRQDTESEAFLISDAKEAISTCNWRIGRNASMWTDRYAKGRTDEDFGNAVGGLTGDQVYQRRRVWDRFGEVSDTYRNLSWSHFYAALSWEDADAYLQWAYENQATVAEMKALRQAQTGDSDIYRKLDPSPSSGQDSEDPFGEGDEGAGTESGTGKETGGTDSEEEEAPRLPGKGKDKPRGHLLNGGDPFLTQKAKTVKTLEASSRAIADLNELHKSPQRDAMVKAVHKMIETVKAWK